jgi:protein TonB
VRPRCDAKVKRGIPGGKPLEEEALRVVNAMPAWSPAKVNGVPVPTEYVLPVAFQLNE